MHCTDQSVSWFNKAHKNVLEGHPHNRHTCECVCVCNTGTSSYYMFSLQGIDQLVHLDCFSCDYSELHNLQSNLETTKNYMSMCIS